MGIFSKEQEVVKVVSSTNLKQQSVNALNTFQRVLDDLRSINELSRVRREELVSESYKISQEISELEGVSINNDKVIINIEKILA